MFDRASRPDDFVKRICIRLLKRIMHPGWPFVAVTELRHSYLLRAVRFALSPVAVVWRSNRSPLSYASELGRNQVTTILGSTLCR
jgi:hypothetical protein